MDLSEKMVSSQTIFEGKIIKVMKDQAQLPDGSMANREVVAHPGGVCVLALDEDRNVTLVKQFRYPIQQQLVELPAGKLEYGEEHYPAAVRELSEETGLEAAEWTYLGYMLSSPGFCTERIHMYLARGLTRQKQHLDEDEFLDVLAVPFEKLAEQVMDGTITDGKTVAATLKTKVLLDL